ncbi:hypothetical protein N4000107 [Escherichia phage vB_EcoM_HZ_ZJUN4]
MTTLTIWFDENEETYCVNIDESTMPEFESLDKNSVVSWVEGYKAAKGDVEIVYKLSGV